MARHYVYILRCADNTLYTGITTDPKRRLHEHNSSRLGAKYTSGRRPVTVVYERYFHSHGAAAREEIRIKRLTRREKLLLFRLS